MALTCADIVAAAETANARIDPYVKRTPLVRSQKFSDATGANVYLKLENLQHTGAFKLRGAMNKLLSLSDEERQKGCVTASSGNHGAAVAWAAMKLGTSSLIFVPEQTERTSPTKIQKIESYGGDVCFYGNDGLQCELRARDHAARHDMIYVPPYNDIEVIAGQGTCGLEIVADLDYVDAAFIAVGGGGLLSGVGSVLKSRNPGMRIVACQPEASDVMAKSIAAGRILDLPSRETLSDGTAGGIEPGSITFEPCAELIDEFVLLDETSIADAMCRFLDYEGHAIEGAAGVAVAAMLASAGAIRGDNVVAIICGGNVSSATLRAIR